MSEEWLEATEEANCDKLLGIAMVHHARIDAAEKRMAELEKRLLASEEVIFQWATMSLKQALDASEQREKEAHDE